MTMPRLPIVTALAPVLALGALPAIAGDPESFVEIRMERILDGVFPGSNYSMLICIGLPDAAPDSVQVTTAGGLVLDLENEDGSLWEEEAQYVDVSTMRNALNGLWTVNVAGPSASTSTFTLDVSGLDDDSFFATPTGVYPGNDAQVAPDASFAWTSPLEPGETADFLFVDNETSFDDSLWGSLGVDATTWDPPEDMPVGSGEFAVMYMEMADPGTATAITVGDGSIVWGRSPFAPDGSPDATPLALYGSETITGFQVLGGAASHVTIGLNRTDDFVFPGAAFLAFVDVGLADGAATGVHLSTTGGLDVDLELDEDDGGDGVVTPWTEELPYPDLATLKSALDGTWTLAVSVPSPSVSSFTVDLAALEDGDVFPTPTGLSPGHGDVDVPADVTLYWNDPTGPATADALLVEVADQRASTLEGSLDIAQTWWTPPLELSPGFNEFSVIYIDVADAGTVSPLSVDEGTILWGSSPFAPAGHPVQTPFTIVGSETIVAFDVGAVCPGDVDGNDVVDFADIVPVLAAWGPCPDCPVDRNDDDVIDFADIVIILSGWGPCDS